jgi:single-stranded-DNA-specific exonuclease
MAAGLSIPEAALTAFRSAFETVTRESLSPADLEGVIETDGELDNAAHDFAFASELENAVWGQGFPAPLFVGEFSVTGQRVLKEKHLKLRLMRDAHAFDAMHFFAADPLPDRIRAVYALMTNEFNGQRSVQLKLHHWEPL